MNRLERRKIKKEINMFSNVVTILKQYFPELIEKLNNLTDTRHQSYVEYSMKVILVVRLMGLLSGIKSMKQLTNSFDTEETILNISNLLEVKLEELPHYDTINEVFENINIEELRQIQKYMVRKLIRSKMFDKYRYKGKYYQVVVDGTGIASFHRRHCKNCLKRVLNKGEPEEQEIYYHYVLEAKLVVGNIVISVDTEFVENKSENIEKQDCEIKAFYRISKRLKKNYPKLRILISGDSLYACKPVIQICIKNRWEYILRFKDGRLKALADEIKGLEQVEGIDKQIRYWNDLKYKEVQIEEQINVLKYEDKEKKRQFQWIVSLRVTEKNKEELVYYGRQRWRIENEGFKEQKKGTFDIEHIYCKEPNAMKAHYFFIQFAHTIRQLLEKGIKEILEIKMNKKEVSAAIIQTLTHMITNLTELKKIQLRFKLE